MKWQWLGKSWYAIIFSIGFILLGILYIREYVNNIGKYGVQIMLIGGSVLIIAGFIQLVYAVVHKLLRIYTQREGDRIARAFHSKQKIYPTIICPSCKKKIAEDYSQCPWCGTELKLHEDEISDTHK